MNVQRIGSWQLPSFLLVLLVFLTACNQPTAISCDTIRDMPSAQIRGESITPNEAADWVADQYTLSREEVRLVEMSPRETWVTWSSAEGLYHQMVFSEESLDTVEITFYQQQISGEALIDCLGEPDFYRARVQQDISLSLVYGFFYLEQGLEVRGAVNVNGNEPHSQMVPTIRFGQVTIHNSDEFPSLQAWESWKPWQGWEQIELDQEP